jgi:hypothetical protein
VLCAAARYISVIVLLPSKRPGVHLADSLHTSCAQAIDYQEHSLMQSSAAFHCSVCVAQLLWDYSRDVAFLRAVFLAAQPRTGPSSTVLVTDVPGLAYGTPTQRVRAWVWGGDWGWWWVVWWSCCCCIARCQQHRSCFHRHRKDGLYTSQCLLHLPH